MIACDTGPRALPCSNILLPPELEHRIPEILESGNFKDSWRAPFSLKAVLDLGI
jgi:hypothetical protein